MLKLREALQMLLDGEAEEVRFFEFTAIHAKDLDRECVTNIVRSRPVTEQRELKRWFCPQCESLFPETRQCCGQTVIESVTTYFAEIPRKERKRVDVSELVTLEHCSLNGQTFPPGHRTFAEWEE